MRARPVRSRIYLPVKRLGVNIDDWKYVAGLTLIAYAGAFFLNLQPYHVPLEYITGFSTLVGSIAFFNWVRVGRRPGWLYYRLRGLFTNNVTRGLLPGDRRFGRRHASWLYAEPEVLSQPAGNVMDILREGHVREHGGGRRPTTIASAEGGI